MKCYTKTLQPSVTLKHDNKTLHSSVTLKDCVKTLK